MRRERQARAQCEESTIEIGGTSPRRSRIERTAPAQHRRAGQSLTDLRRAREHVRAAARPTRDRERVETEHVGKGRHVACPIEHRAPARSRRDRAPADQARSPGRRDRPHRPRPIPNRAGSTACRGRTAPANPRGRPTRVSEPAAVGQRHGAGPAVVARDVADEIRRAHGAGAACARARPPSSPPTTRPLCTAI